jgi:cysteine desulfurase family protein
MIYFDNAATTLYKPEEVITAVIDALTSLGNAGRGASDAVLGANRIIFNTRESLCRLFHAENPRQVVFTSNATESLNTAIKGLLKKGDHVITTMMEHNSVLRPLYEMDIELEILKVDKKGNLSYKAIDRAIKPQTKAIISTHASNVTGNIVDVKQIGEIAQTRGIKLIVDASQTAGVIPIDVNDMNIAVLCFTGHKSLLGPQGTGGMVVSSDIRIKPLKSGGSGVDTYNKHHPNVMPTLLEAGTLNGHGIAGLGAGVNYLEKVGLDVIRKKEQDLMWKFYQGIKEIPGVTIYGDFTSKNRCPIVALNIYDYDSSDVSDTLCVTYGIQTRPGAHCAPLMHEALGTVNQGAVRFSFSHYNTDCEVEKAICAIKEIANI